MVAVRTAAAKNAIVERCRCFGKAPSKSIRDTRIPSSTALTTMRSPSIQRPLREGADGCGSSGTIPVAYEVASTGREQTVRPPWCIRDARSGRGA
jgi:hypothetical protein